MKPGSLLVVTLVLQALLARLLVRVDLVNEVVAHARVTGAALALLLVVTRVLALWVLPGWCFATLAVLGMRRWRAPHEPPN